MKSQTAWFSLFVGLTAFGAAYAAPNALTTAPWQQNVYTNRFTIFCETQEVIPGLQLQYGNDYGRSVAMTCVPGDSDGETQHFIYKGRVDIDDAAGTSVGYRVAVGSTPLKCPDGSDATGTVRLWKDDPNEKLSVALWSDNQVGAKSGDYDLDRFAFIRAAFGRMVAHDVDFGISTGDMTTSGDYAGQTRPCVLDGGCVLGRTRPYYVSFGNHDDYVAPDEMNKRYFETGSLDEPGFGDSNRGAYCFYRGNVLFIFLHWPHDGEKGDYSVYRTWLQDLLATPRAKQAKFRLLFMHKPMFLEVWSEGSEGKNYDTSLYDTAIAGGVDMVVSGHMHGYERTVTDKGLVQLVNGGMGSLDHKEHVVNNYGDWTKMGGHRNIPYLWARQSAWKKPTLCGYFPVNMGCITSYCEMKIDGGELNVQAHGFCANGDYIGVFDDFTLVSKTDRTPPTPRRAVTAACADPSSFDTFVNTPVTNAKWKEYKDAVDEDFTYATADASKPVVNVSKDEITRFCAWLNNGASGVSYRLPTEAELRAKRTNLAGTVTEWTSTVDQETGWCRILGGNALASNTVWTASGDKPAIAASGCHANYLGFRLVKESGTEAYDVTLESLLDEMCDPDAATRLAALPWTGRLWSSYDRASVSPADSSTWFANNDRSQFVRTMQVGDRTECVMVDAKGPGALTRLWTANGYGTIYRFYVDGATEPVVCGVGTNLIGGHVLCPAPLADEVSLLLPPEQRALDLYLPITFAQSLVVTAELKGIPPDDDPGKTLRLWYNAEVRTYAEGTRVEPFSSAVLARAQGAIAAANAALRAPSAPATDETKSLDGALAPGASRSITFTREGAIRSFALKLTGDGEPLRSVRVKIMFDGETTVDAAVGQLFGAGYVATPYATVNGGVAADGTLTLLQVMPFATSCTVTLENTGPSACTVSASSVAVGGYEWDAARSLHFGALGFEERALPTRRGAAGCYDLPWVKLEGQGHLVGNTLMLDNSQSDQWWGEGDEKIYIDGETFPSYFGTGTEDFFGYAWGHGKPFAAHPFLALPLAGEVLTGGRRLVTTVRTRRLDVVPFATSLKLDVEIWHWEDCAMDYAPATFWYARPGVSITPGGLTPSPPGTPVLTAPADFTPVPTLNEEILEFNALSSDVKSDVLLKEADNAAYRERLSAAYKTGLPAITLAWDGTEGRCEVKVWRECDGKLVLDTTSTTRTAVFWDAEIGRNYRWTVTCGESAATGYFYTESAGPRLINEQYGQVANVRDLGGWATADGLVVRQGVLFRTGSFGALTGIGAPYFTGTLGVRQDVDLRPEDAILAEDVTPYGGSVGVSPLGASVPRYCSDVAKGVAFLGNYADLFKNDGYQQAFWYNFVELNTELKLPAVFHCSAGRDRTGCIAYVIGAVLGVSADDLATDYYTSWASQGWIDRDTTAAHQAKWLPAFVNGLNAAYPPAQYPTLRQQAEKFLSDCCVKAGGTVAQAQAAIAALRARMLEIPEAPRTAGGKYPVSVPTIASKPATGAVQTADLVRSGFYTVTANAGGVDAGDYPVELTLNDPDNACWADGTVGATKTLTFTIRAGRLVGDRTWIGAAGDGNWTTAENWDPLESPAAGEGAAVTNAAGMVTLDADVTLAKLNLGRDAAVRFVNGGAARTFAVTAQSGSVLGQGGSTLKFSNGGKTATIDVDGWGGICTKGSSAALYLGGSTAGKLTVNLRFAPDAAEKYAADSNLKAVFTTATEGTSSKIYLYSGVAFNVDVANFASAKEGTWKLPLCYQAQTGSYGAKNLPAGDCLRLLNAGAQADRYTLACTAEGQYVYLTLVRTATVAFTVWS